MRDNRQDIHPAATAAEAMARQLAATVAALQQPASYPDEAGAVASIETHMSWVFLTRTHAYKLKKPIRTAMLDHTTVEARRHACETELALNRRLARDVYLAVVPLVRCDGDLRVEGTGSPIDWLVKMRRLPRNRMLDTCIRRQTAQRGDIARLAVTLVGFYERAEPAPADGAAYCMGISADIASKRASLEQPRYGLERRAVGAVVARLEDWLARHGSTVAARAVRVVDAHGDLRPEHICLEPQPVVIDCLEFNRGLRLLDPVSELSFLALECRRLGATWIGDEVLATYVRETADHAPARLIAFYQSHHALVRAAVAVWHLDNGGREDVEVWRERGKYYLQAARELLDAAG